MELGSTQLNPRERLLRALAGEAVDRPPVICPGGMMTMATAEAMEACGCGWPEAHNEAEAMARLVMATQEGTGLESLSVPFCMTVEAEALGCELDMGDEVVLPHVSKEAISDISEVDKLPGFDAKKSGRAPVVLEAIEILASRSKESMPYPVIGAVVGPVSLAATVMEARDFLRLIHRDPPAAQRLVEAMERVCLQFVLAQYAAGADCVMVAEPTATGDVLGGRHFGQLALPVLGRLLGKLQQEGVPFILHICGDLRRICAELRSLAERLEARIPLSVDAMVSGRFLRAELPGCIRIGNISAFLLEKGNISSIEEAAKQAAEEFDIVSPACGLAPSTPNRHLKALVEVIKRKDAAD